MGAEASFLELRHEQSLAQKRLEGNRLLPDLNLEYFQGTNKGLGTSLYGVQLGLRVPLLFFGGSNRLKASKIQTQITELENRDMALSVNREYRALKALLEQQAGELAYYEREGSALSKEILKTASGNYL